jgi:hypothetical protein
MVMTAKSKNSAGPASSAASMRIFVQDAPGTARSRYLWAFSIITIAASTMVPSAIAIPPRPMIFELKPMTYSSPHGDQHADRQHQDGDQRAADMQQKEDADDDAFRSAYVSAPSKAGAISASFCSTVSITSNGPKPV